MNMYEHVLRVQKCSMYFQQTNYKLSGQFAYLRVVRAPSFNLGLVGGPGFIED